MRALLPPSWRWRASGRTAFIAGAALMASLRDGPGLAFFAASPSTRPRLSPLLVVLDLDETLVHATLCRPSNLGPEQEQEIPSWLPSRLAQPKVDFQATGKGLVLGLGEEVPLFVSLRPGARDFVSWLLREQGVEVAVYTAGTEAYAQQSLEQLGLSGVSAALFRDECVPLGLPITKDLTKLGRDLSRVVLVDNARRSFWLQPENGLLVSDWKGRNATDSELERVREELLKLLSVEDVRPLLKAQLPVSDGPSLLPFLALSAAAAGVLAVLSSRGGQPPDA
ncbi:unnamed protein product [Polarella glacialis]|uniref:Mitochondrial import inner membrane translocase subunit TIM50 n=1 Tax=Polarella glacialis TaxID=89957 RepID=A0A813H6Q2_POLGL|nr:unnamed protein product [Polarella glacialis]